MDGLAAHIKGRPVIVISKKHQQSAWLAFILAHELGHIQLGHTKDLVAVARGKLSPNTGDRSSDVEFEANQFAQQLLTGSKLFQTGPRNLTTDELFDEVRRSGDALHVDPGTLALSYAFHKQFFATTNAVLKRLEPAANALGQLNEQFMALMAFGRLPDDSAEFLKRVASPV